MRLYHREEIADTWTDLFQFKDAIGNEAEVTEGN